jgi:hypothetical protein
MNLLTLGGRNVRKLMDRHKNYKKQQIIEKDLGGSKILLQKYDTCRALALKLVTLKSLLDGDDLLEIESC